MAIYHFKLPWPVISTATGELVRNRGDGQLYDLNGTPAVSMTPLGVPAPVSTGKYGTTGEFTAEIEAGFVRFGDADATVYSNETFLSASLAAEAKAAAEDAQARIAQIAVNSTAISYIRRDSEGRVFFTNYPISEGGGQPVIRPDGTAYIRFE